MNHLKGLLTLSVFFVVSESMASKGWGIFVCISKDGLKGLGIFCCISKDGLKGLGIFYCISKDGLKGLGYLCCISKDSLKDRNACSLYLTNELFILVLLSPYLYRETRFVVHDYCFVSVNDLRRI